MDMTPSEKLAEAPNPTLERAARALRDKEWGTAGPWEDADASDHAYWIDSARAALEALMEPSAAMTDAGAEMCEDAYSGRAANAVWKAMLAEALK
jgi:hypothetical protein